MRKTWKPWYGARAVASLLPQLARASLAAHGANARILTDPRYRRSRPIARRDGACEANPVKLPQIADQALRHALERLGHAVVARARV